MNVFLSTCTFLDKLNDMSKNKNNNTKELSINFSLNLLLWLPRKNKNFL
jgi:hypothetical protein